ncbi:MAG: hypothetical protein KDA21_00450 [Phycisphaerales bacterium]|nr:hypothetical protein [Phycisphaerales bacterium]
MRVFAALLGVAALTSPSLAVGGTAPPSDCGKTLVFARALPGSPLAGGVVNIGGVVFFELTGTCVPGPYVMDASVEIDFGTFGTFSDSILTAVSTGFTNLPFAVLVPPGAPLNCVVRGQATVTFPDGTEASAALPPTLYCFAREKPGMPGTPLLEVQRQSGAAAFAHPGDQTIHVLSVTNHGNADFIGTLTLQSRQQGQLPVGGVVSEPPGSGLYSNSAPISGENFPIALPGHVDIDGCVILPPNPHSAQIPMEIENLVIAPGQTKVFDIAARSWPLSARGNMSHLDARVEGTISSQNVAGCAAFIIGADSQVQPTYLCIDAGATTTIQPVVGNQLLFFGNPSSMSSFQVVADLAGVQINVVGQVPFATDLTVDAASLTNDHGRIRAAISRAGNPTLFDDTDIFDLTLDFQVRNYGTPTFPAISSIQTILNAPTGFQTLYPYAIGRAEVLTDGRGSGAIFEFLYQLSIDAITSDKVRVPVDIQSMNVAATPTGFRVVARGSAAGLRGVSTTLGELDVKGDFRGTTGIGLGPHSCPGDITGDSMVDFNDLNEVLANWGLVVPPKTNGDCDGDSDVDFDDLNIVLNYWGTSC